MKIKTSITLSEDLLDEIDNLIKDVTNRSAFIEQAIRTYLLRLKREKREKLDLDILSKESDKLNKEARDTLSYQEEL